MNQDYLFGLIGGVLIGLSSTLLMYWNGRIAGISGILGGMLKPATFSSWRATFLLGLVLGALFVKLIAPEFFSYKLSSNYLLMGVAGLIVGIGTQLGSGCTSGHGVCGLPRRSARSLVATLTFMGVAIITVFIKGLMI